MENQNSNVKFGIHRIYLKDLSFESPAAPELFRKQWKPKLNLEVESKSTKLEDGVYEVVLELTVTAKLEDKVGFIIEIEQAGIFTVQGMDEATQKHTLAAYCPNVLFPYARETIDSLTVKGSLPPLMLAPVNFDHLFEQAQKKTQNSK